MGGALALVATLLAPAAAPAGCAGQQVPPPPAAVTEVGTSPVAPLAWPAEPVGGPALAACGDLGPAGVPTVGTAAFVIADLDTGAVLAARAPHARHLPASTLKILTAIVALHGLDPDTVVDGSAEDLRIEGSKAGIGPGGRYTVRQLLQGLLLNSGNDTAEALARALGGDATTVAAMTSTARELGALDTRPATPSGLDGPGMASSAYDLALLFRVAMRDPLFAATTATRSVQFPGYAEHPGFALSNNDRLLANYPGTLGAKAGFTDAARHTLVGAAERNGRRLVVALVRGEQRPIPMWKQAGALLDWGFVQPVDAAPVGVLVDAAPAPPPAPVTSVTSELAAESPSGELAAESPSGRAPTAAGVLLGAALVVAWLAVLNVRRTRRRFRG